MMLIARARARAFSFEPSGPARSVEPQAFAATLQMNKNQGHPGTDRALVWILAALIAFIVFRAVHC